ncbi:Probable poly(glycerol-phosphate) alpha-glucosyltransferase [Aerococcus viridans]|nr:Probable poly(glycerol-phosphate) alpha-glucosyltransferase [Aerococcus viridans]
MKDILILLTNYFPYYKGEEYLESELPILASKYEKIFILSCMIDDNEIQTRSVPSNVIVIPSGINHKPLGRIKMVLKSLLIKGIEKTPLTFFQNMYSKYFESRSKIIANQLKERLSKFNVEQYPFITIYSYWTYITARVGIDLKEKYTKNNKKVNLISRAHRYDLYEEDTKLDFLPERNFIFSSLDFIYPVSNNGTEYLKKKYPLYSQKIETRYLGTMDPKIKLDYGKHPFRVVSCSALRSVKRVELIVEAISILQNEGLEIYWTHLGDGEKFSKINKIAETALAPNTYHLPGFVKNDKVFEFYKNDKASIFVNVSESEGLPVSIMEAISMGLPIIATDVGGTSEIVSEKNGFLLESNTNARILAEAIKKIYLMDDMSYKELSINSRGFWEKNFNALNNYNEFADEISI